MKHVPVAQSLELVIRGVFGGAADSKWANIFHLFAAGMDTQSSTQLSDLLDDTVNSFATSGFYLAQATNFGSSEIQLTGSDGTTQASVVAAVSTLVGTDTGDDVFGSPAAVVSWKGAWHYRGGKPRTYVGGLTENWIDTATALNGAHCASLQTAAQDLITAVSAQSGSYGSAVSLGVVLGNNATSAGTFAPFTGAGVSNQVGSQRRRNRPH